jgi:hypothetical protein
MSARTSLLVGTYFLLTAAIVFSTQASGESSVGWADPRLDANTNAKLKSLVVSVRWDKADILQVIRDLEAKSVKADPAHIGLRFKLNLPADSSQVMSHGYPVQRTVSILLENATLSDILAYICEQTNLVVRAHNGIVTLTLWDAEDQQADLHAPPVRL